jgi:hypothetical protein
MGASVQKPYPTKEGRTAMKRRTGLLITAILAGTLAAADTAPAPPLPDLTCKISARRTSQGGPAIVGSEINFSGGSPSVWITVWVGNESPTPTGDFWLGFSIKNNGSRIAGLPGAQRLSLANDLWTYYGPFRVNLPSVTNKIEANAIADVGNFLGESNESNNTCKLVLTATVAH